MPDLWLIAHKVRGEPAFDVATQVECPLCSEGLEGKPMFSCPECDETGYWWIIPTSGHRAYPWWHLPLKIENHEDLLQLIMDHNPNKLTWTIFPMPSDLPDHYQTRAEPSRLAQLKAMLPPAKPIHRRF